MILLAASNSGTLIYSILFVLIIAVGIAFFLIMNKKEKNEAREFIIGLADEFYKLIINEVTKFNENIEKYETLEEYFDDLLEDIYNVIYDYTVGKAYEVFGLNSIICKFITKEMINELVNQVIDSGNIKGLVRDNWSKYFEEKVTPLNEIEDVAVGHDVDGNEIVYSGNEYYEDFEEKTDLPVVEEEKVDEEALSRIIPPSDNENEEFSDDVVEDEQQEEITLEYSEVETSTDDLPYFVDKNGRKRDKITGRYTK